MPSDEQPGGLRYSYRRGRCATDIVEPFGAVAGDAGDVERTWIPATATPPIAAFDVHLPMLRRYLHTLGARSDRVDDLVQETCVVALQKPIEDRGAWAQAAWLRGVARNLLLRERRSAAQRREVELADEVWNEQCGDGGGSELVEALRECLRQLPERSRALLQRAYAEGGGRVELGQAFGLVADGVKTALRRLRAALKECMQRRLGRSS